MLPDHINDLITMAKSMRDNPTSNKKAINKTIGRLEEAQLWAEKIQPGRVTGVVPAQVNPNSTAAPTGSAYPTTAGTCTCMLGAINRNCPVHGNVPKN